MEDDRLQLDFVASLVLWAESLWARRVEIKHDAQIKLKHDVPGNGIELWHFESGATS